MNNYHFHLGQIKEAKQLVLEHHYSHAWPAGVQLIGTWHEDGGLFGDSGPAIAACVFNHGARAWSEPVLDLIRLVRHPDHHPSLSGLISQTARWAHRKGFDLLVSYADATHDHHGGIYQASSWNYHGMRKSRVDAFIIDGVRYPARTVNAKFGTQSVKQLTIRGFNVTELRDSGKHLYWRCHGKTGRNKAHRLGLQTLPYPKPDHTPTDV